MFKIGDKVVSIKNIDLHCYDRTVHVDKYDVFTVVNTKHDYLYFEEIFGVFKNEYFISLPEYRKIKLNNLCLR